MSALSNKPSILKKISLIFLGIFFCLVLLELGLRLGGVIFISLQEHRNRSSLFERGAYRIMCLGDSTTANQYPIFLEEALNQRHIGVKFSVIDKGVISINSLGVLFRLEKNLDTYKPDMVITMIGNNDRGISYYKDIPDSATGVFQHCRVYRLIRLIYTHIVKKLKEANIDELERDGFKRNARLSGSSVVAKKEGILNEELFKKAIALDPNDDRAYVGLGEIYREQGKLSEAEESFKKAIALNSNNDETYFRLGEVYRRQGRIAEAEKSFRKAISLDPNDDRSYIRLGSTVNYRQEIKLPEAEGFFKKAIALNPNDDRAYLGLGVIYRRQGKFFEAEESFKKAIALNPNNTATYFRLGEVYRKQGMLSEAEGTLKKAIALDPNNNKVCRALESLYGEINKTASAETYSKKIADGYSSFTAGNYLKIKEILDRRGIRLVCVQYPVRSIAPLRKIFEGKTGVLFVDNKQVFREAISRTSYREYFNDMFAGDFGHCAPKGNKLLAENIANVILKEVFNK